MPAFEYCCTNRVLWFFLLKRVSVYLLEYQHQLGLKRWARHFNYDFLAFGEFANRILYLWVDSSVFNFAFSLQTLISRLDRFQNKSCLPADQLPITNIYRRYFNMTTYSQQVTVYSKCSRYYKTLTPVKDFSSSQNQLAKARCKCLQCQCLLSLDSKNTELYPGLISPVLIY